MFFREKKTSSNPTLQLVESYRDAKGKCAQRMVVSLAGCTVPDDLRRLVSVEVTHRMAGYERLLDDDPLVELWTKRVLDRIEEAGKLPGVSRRETPSGRLAPELVCVDDVEHADGAVLGPYLVLLQAWKSLGLDDVLEGRKLGRSQIAAAKASVMNRLVEPVSENELPAWVATTALGDLLGVRSEGWAEDRFYRVSDRLLGLRGALEVHLREKERDLFNLDRTIILYDLTNTYFEGTAADNELARRSAASKEKRTDCPQISVGLALDAEGFVITHRVFAGNVSDCRTLLDAVGELREAEGMGPSKPVVVVDGGMATDSNLAELRERGFDYVVNGKRQKRAEFAEDFLDVGKFRRVEGRGKATEQQPVFVRRIESDGEKVVLCRSEGRREKEDAIQDGAERRLVDGLEKLRSRILRNDPRLKLAEGRTPVDRAVGSLVSRTTRASKLYSIDYCHEARSLVWRRKEEWDADRELHGCYHLRSTLDLDDQQLWHIYITLTKVEDAFRSMKDGLGLRPVNHSLADRCRAHVWITVLAYHLQRWTEHSLKLAGYECTWRRLRRSLETHGYATVIVPTAGGLEHHSRKPGRPNHLQKLVYGLLGIDWKSLPVTRRTYKTGTCTKT